MVSKLIEKRNIQAIVTIFLLSVFFIIAFLDTSYSQRRRTKRKPKIEILGRIRESTDFFGRKKLIGWVVNKGGLRADFIRIEFSFLNKDGILLEKVTRYIDGSTNVFGDTTKSHSSLRPGKRGSFTCFTSIFADSVASFKYNIKYEVYPFE